MTGTTRLAPEAYSRLAMTLHWIIAAALALQFALGWTMVQDGVRFYGAYQLHKSLGITVLLLTLARVAQRLWRPQPAPAEGGWTGRLARIGNVGLYAFMIGAPLTGWLLVSTAPVRVATRLFGTVPWPHLPVEPGLHGMAESAHEILAWVGVGLIAAHLGGAARHLLLLRDGVVWRMVPRASASILGMLALTLGLAAGAGLLLPSALASPAAATGDDLAKSSAPPAIAVATSPQPLPSVTPGPAPETTDTEGEEQDEAADSQQADESAPPPAWRILPGGMVRFAVGMEGGSIEGAFSRWGGSISMDPERPQSAEIAITIELDSLTMDDATQRDTALGGGFLNAAQHPQATFRSNSVTREGGNNYRAQGTLTINDIARPQSVAFSLSGSGETRDVTGSASIAREAYGVGAEDMGFAIAPDVTVTFEFEARKQS